MTTIRFPLTLRRRPEEYYKSGTYVLFSEGSSWCLLFERDPAGDSEPMEWSGYYVSAPGEGDPTSSRVGDEFSLRRDARLEALGRGHTPAGAKREIGDRRFVSQGHYSVKGERRRGWLLSPDVASFEISMYGPISGAWRAEEGPGPDFRLRRVR